MTTAQKLAYLKGIIDASNITDTTQKKIYETLIDLLDSMLEDVEFNTENIDNIDSRLSEVDEDLELVESILYDDELEAGFEDDEYDDDEDDDEYDDDFAAEECFAGLDEMEADSESAPEQEQEAYESDAEDELSDDLFEEADEDDFDEEEDGEEMYEIECPACHETIYLQESVILEGSVDCPNCGEPLEFDIEFEEE